MKNFYNDLLVLLKSKTPCIWIKTYEEQRVMAEIKKIIIDNYPNTKLISWSFFAGRREEPLVSDVEEVTNSDRNFSPDRLYMEIIENQQKGRVIVNSNGKKEIVEKEENFYLLKDFHLCNSTPQILRGLRDVKERPANEMKSYNPVIVLSPMLNIPAEHEKLFTVLEYNTPNKDLIKKQIGQFVKALNPQKHTIPTDEELNLCYELAQGLTLDEIKNYTARSIYENKTISSEVFFKARLDLIKKAEVLDYKMSTMTLDEMGGNHAFKAWVKDIKSTFTPEAVAFGVSKPKGFLASGPAGTSKTLSAYIMANELNIPLLQFNISKVN